jgi:hypothetical protein
MIYNFLVPKYFDIYYNVPYSKKDDFKKLGGRWSITAKKWYIRCYLDEDEDTNIQNLLEKLPTNYDFSNVIWDKGGLDIKYNDMDKEIYKYFNKEFPLNKD